MYPQSTIDQFIELRAQRVSIDKAFPQLHISRSTAVTWNCRYKAQIAELRALHFEAACERIGLNYEHELAYAAGQLARIRAELNKRKLEHVSTEFIFNAEVTSFARVQKLWRMAEPPEVTEPDSENQPVSDLFPHQNRGEGGQNSPPPPTEPSTTPDPGTAEDINGNASGSLSVEQAQATQGIEDRPLPSVPSDSGPDSKVTLATNVQPAGPLHSVPDQAPNPNPPASL